MAHNPEVEGSNPSPATKARGPFSNRGRAFGLWMLFAAAMGKSSPGGWSARCELPGLTARPG